MKAIDLLAITRACKSDATWLPILLAFQKVVDAREEYRKQLMETIESINYGNEMKPNN